LARFFEQRALRRFVSIFCTMPANARYLRDRFRLSAGQRVAITPIWARLRPELAIDRASERATHRLPAESPIAVFGGQMVAGRGFEQILVAARHALADGSPLRFLLIGDGPLASTIAARAVDLPNVEFRLPVPREDYLRLIAACDVGLAVTVIGVTSFSFPSKILDYLAAGLPVVASLESGNEACEILETFGVGVSVPLDDARKLFLSAERLAVDPLARVRAREGGRRCLEDVFDVRHTVSALLRESA
jgi:glycosyltransferase involved in cell wall biosynthesis